jgi:hypothetical protein
MVFSQIRDYLHELRTSIRTEWKIFQKHESHPDSFPIPDDSDYRRLFQSQRDYVKQATLTEQYKKEYADTYAGFVESDLLSSEPFEFYGPLDQQHIPENRLPAPGIFQLNYKFHRSQVVSPTEQVPESGYALHPLLDYLIGHKYPKYRFYVNKYCRPLGTTDATFADFNKPQHEYPPVESSLIQRILPILTFFMYAKPFLPLHWIDSFRCRMPIHTGTSYFYRHDYDHRTHAAFSHPKEYANKQTSKGYYFNAFSEWSRTVVHRIKEFALPFDPTRLSPSDIRSRLMTFFIEHATLLFTRNHISDRDGALKQRPVYAMDTLFIQLEAMITFPLHVLARSDSSCIMYSLETIRGGCARMSSLARSFRSYLCIDWSAYDQRMPWIIVDIFWTVFLPSLIIINQGYAPVFQHPVYPDLTPDKLFTRIFNIICFLRTWYYNCVFVTADGYGYIRMFAGIASGMLNTQYLDSFCNMFLLIHSLFHFGCTESEIYEIMFFVMGDDNVLLTQWNIAKLERFMSFLEKHALTRFGMVLSKTKSIVTILRNRIEMLGYVCNDGFPTRPIGKLVAQLCYPEHGYKDKYMSSRAVGMAWASAGTDPTFYYFCRDVYLTFLPYAEQASPEVELSVRKHLPGMFKMLDNIDEFITIERFPSLHEIQYRFRHWQGPLGYTPKWNPAHFSEPPDFCPPGSVTMSEYMTENHIEFPPITRLYI